MVGPLGDSSRNFHAPFEGGDCTTTMRQRDVRGVVSTTFHAPLEGGNCTTTMRQLLPFLSLVRLGLATLLGPTIPPKDRIVPQ